MRVGARSIALGSPARRRFRPVEPRRNKNEQRKKKSPALPACWACNFFSRRLLSPAARAYSPHPRLLPPMAIRRGYLGASTPRRIRPAAARLPLFSFRHVHHHQALRHSYQHLAAWPRRTAIFQMPAQTDSRGKGERGRGLLLWSTHHHHSFPPLFFFLFLLWGQIL
jgi:hypothetical protein